MRRGNDTPTVRQAPTAAVFALHRPRQAGKCDWCGQPCEERTAVRKQLRPRHQACEAEWMVCIRPEQARWQVEKRDHGICCDCGEDWSGRFRCRPENASSVETGNCHGSEGQWGTASYIRIPSNTIVWVSLWHVDHVVPLWRVQHMPDLQRIEYFKLANLVTRCEPCHAVKTRKEAAERAKYNGQSERLEAEEPARRSGPKHKIPSRKMAGGRDSDFKRTMGGKVVKRERKRR